MAFPKFHGITLAAGAFIENATLERLAADPVPVAAGRLWYNTTDKVIKFSSLDAGGAIIIEVIATGNAAAALASRVTTLEGLVATLQATYINKDGSVAFTGDIDAGGNSITNVAAPAAGTDAVNKAYVDGLVQGVDAKLTAAAATSAALPSCVYANGTAGVGATLTASVNGVLTVDGYAPVLNDLILVKDEVAAANNGLYQLTTLGTASVKWVLTRVVGMDQSTEFGGALVAVQDKGNVNDNTLWLCLASDSITPGTTTLSFTRLNSPTTYTAGNGIDISAQVVAAKLQSGGGLVADSNGLAIDTSVVARKYATNVGDGSSATIVVTHNLNTEDVVLSLREIATKEEVLVDWEHTSVNTITLKFASAAAAAQFRVVVLG